MEQRVIETECQYELVGEWILKNSIQKLMLVAGNSATRQSVFDYIQSFCSNNSITTFCFADFNPNPDYSSIVNSVRLFRTEEVDGIIAIGGGSAIDVAKCIKLYSNMPGSGEDGSFLRTEIVPNKIPFLVIPTTAGTGSEATRYAVIYYKGEKQSISHESCIPDTVVLDPALLKSLSLYQRKATMMDAFSHAIEAYWSVNSTEESKGYSEKAIKGILDNYQGYLNNDSSGNAGMLNAAFYAGKAINITQTTAGHAMCYKLTSLFGYAHGHSAALCNKVLFLWMLNNIDRCSDARGEQYLKDTLFDLGKAFDLKDSTSAAEFFSDFVDKLGLELPKASAQQIEELVGSVNPVRLKNFPITLDESTIRELYLQIAKG